jgi:hypothetical protein
MISYLDKLEVTANLCSELESGISVQIQCSREKYEALVNEIKEEYNLDVADDVKISREKIDNQLSNIYGIRLHQTLFLFHIKD